MSFKKSKLELLIRVRYSNPLPAPPCPLKLLDIPTDPMHYMGSWECHLSRWDCLWEENGDNSATSRNPVDEELNPDPNNLPKLDPKDRFLLGDPASAGPVLVAGPSSGTSTLMSSVPHVPWLRKTEYLSRDGSMHPSVSQEIKQSNDMAIDVSHDTQLRDIDASFAVIESSELSALCHPIRPELTAVEAFKIFPDADIWVNTYDLFRFSERPGDRPPDIDDPRLDCAILRPMEADGDHFLAYYLTKEDKAALEFKQGRAARDPGDVPDGDEPTYFHFVRDYEMVKVEQEVPNEFLLMLDEGTDEFETDVQGGVLRPKGAYYKNIERKMLLKKKRVNTYESYGDKWDIVKLTHTPMSKEEEQEREEALAEVTDPLFPLARADADADTDGELDDGAFGLNGASAETANTIRQEAINVFGEE
ncbi:hypothetical protein GSI_04684 [Ganoderma sinense ZZ0214-1]|uniref:RNA polymerase II-associated protein n=1 Tax=Ganoderma sinense ZZ0214-1 TaxID=1077348 RepID=A0A2G8SHI3_9APHY|nr:hypothetical protein GSI_04684 [Ganoderma sinense ZZ0214-1]